MLISSLFTFHCRAWTSLSLFTCCTLSRHPDWEPKIFLSSRPSVNKHFIMLPPLCFFFYFSWWNKDTRMASLVGLYAFVVRPCMFFWPYHFKCKALIQDLSSYSPPRKFVRRYMRVVWQKHWIYKNYMESNTCNGTTVPLAYQFHVRQ